MSVTKLVPNLVREGPIAFVAEAPGEQEAIAGVPLVGPSGQLFDRFLKWLAVDRDQVFIGNVFQQRPTGNKVAQFFMPLAQARKTGWHKECPYPQNESLGFVRPEYVQHVDRLREEIERANPNVVVAMGATSLWALTGLTGISKYRGVFLPCTLAPGRKVLPTYHPAYVIRQWKSLPVVALDFSKAYDHRDTPDIERRDVEVWLRPTLDDIREWRREHAQPGSVIAFDIETAGEEITCIGFASNNKVAIVIPFVDTDSRDGSYWESPEEELEAWILVEEILGDETTEKVAHNSSYDCQWLIQKYGVLPRGKVHDTMLIHHSLQPEWKKSLGFLSSLYLDHPAWKELVDHKGASENKADS